MAAVRRLRLDGTNERTTSVLEPTHALAGKQVRAGDEIRTRREYP